MFYVAIDTREQKIINYLNENNSIFYDSKKNEIKYGVQHLAVGDFIIFHNNIALVVIERKTWKDLAAGFYDGRKDNIQKMISYSQETNARLAYIFEGPAFPSPNTKYGRIPYKNLRAHIDHLLYRDNIIELRSQNKINTIERIFEFVKNMSSLEKFSTSTTKGGAAHLELAKVSIKKTPETCYTLIWAAFPHVGALTAKLMLGWTICEFFNGMISEDTISALEYSTGAVIGAQKAKKILAITKKESEKQYTKILARIPGISLVSAKLIAKEIGKDIFMDKENLKKIFKLTKGTKPLTNAKSIVKALDLYIYSKLQK